ncbi:MAG TPA: hypothetical protein DCM87_19175 [Planctomycetes bacterium]|nr:hypothetical protein [Planctomycetota bacterium]
MNIVRIIGPGTVILGVIALAGDRAAAGARVSDGEFAAGTWIIEHAVSALAQDSAVNAAGAQSDGGNPGACMRADITIGVASLEGAAALFLYACARWDPAVHGPIHAIDAAFDFVSRSGTPARIGILLRQGGAYYAHVLDTAAATGQWTTFRAADLHPEDFPPLMPFETGRPDFSTAGGPIAVGFAVGQFAAFAEGSTSFVCDADNWELTFNPAPAAMHAADGDFGESAWTVESVLSPLGQDSVVNAVTTPPDGGAPGACREIDITLGTAATEGAAVLQLSSLLSWNPAVMGPVRAIDTGFEFVSVNGAPTRLGFIVAQNGKYYAHVPDAQSTAAQWTTYRGEGLTADDFPPLFPFETGRPDFSAAGAEIRFGLATGQIAMLADGHTSFVHRVDGWFVTVNPERLAVVPPDGDFAPGAWEVEEFVSPTAQESSVDASVTRDAGGNPDAYREIELTVGTAATEGAAAAHILTAFEWDLAVSGPIFSIDASLDFRSLNGAPLAVGIVVEQGGRLYQHMFDDAARNTAWTAFQAAGILPGDFAPVVPLAPGEIDLSSSGGIVHFGFAVGQVGEFGGGFTSFIAGIDNWRISVNPVPVIAQPCGGIQFRRGDANADGNLDIADAIAVLTHLFAGGPCRCEDSSDANDDEALDIADAITVLAHLFAGAGPLRPPFGTCGPDPAGDALDCAGYMPCP